MDAIKIGGKLRVLRGQKAIKEVSDALDISVSALAMYERGERIPRDEIKIKLANYYGKSVGELFFSC